MNEVFNKPGRIKMEYFFIKEDIKYIFYGITRRIKIFLNPQNYPFRNIKVGVVVSNLGKSLNNNTCLVGFIERNLIDKGAKIILLNPKKILSLFETKEVNITLFNDLIDLLIIGKLLARKRNIKFKESEFENEGIKLDNNELKIETKKKHEMIEYHLKFSVYQFSCNRFVGSNIVLGTVLVPKSPIEIFKKIAKKVVESIIVERESKNKNEITKIKVHTEFDEIIKNLMKPKII